MQSSTFEASRGFFRLLGCASLIASLVLGGPTGAFAASKADKTRAQARTLLVEGSDLMGNGEYGAALEKFQQAYQLVPSPKIQYNFGQAYDAMGKPAEALEAFRRFVSEAKDAAPANVTKAKALIEGLEKKVAILVLTGDVDNATVSVDGRAYELGNDREVVINPGPHSVSAEKPGQAPFLARLTASANERVQVVIRFAITPAAEPVRPVAGRDPVEEPHPTPVPKPVQPGEGEGGGDDAPVAAVRTWQKPAAWATAGVAAGVAVLGYLNIKTSNDKFTEFNLDENHCSKVAPNKGDPGCDELYSSGESARKIGIVSFVGAGVLAATSVVLFLTLPEEGRAKESRVACAPLLGAGATGASCGLTF